MITHRTNMFTYVQNNPVDMIDPEGLGHYAKTFCDGSTLRWEFTRTVPEELKKCLAAHEEDHVLYIPSLIPNPCCPKDRFLVVLSQNPDMYYKVECRGHGKELKCLNNQRPTTTIVQRRQKELRDYLRKPKCSRFN